MLEARTGETGFLRAASDRNGEAQLRGPCWIRVGEKVAHHGSESALPDGNALGNQVGAGARVLGTAEAGEPVIDVGRQLRARLVLQIADADVVELQLLFRLREVRAPVERVANRSIHVHARRPE